MTSRRHRMRQWRRARIRRQHAARLHRGMWVASQRRYRPVPLRFPPGTLQLGMRTHVTGHAHMLRNSCTHVCASMLSYNEIHAITSRTFIASSPCKGGGPQLQASFARQSVCVASILYDGLDHGRTAKSTLSNPSNDAHVQMNVTQATLRSLQLHV